MYKQVRQAIEVWTERYEKKQETEYSSAKDHFHRFCETMDAYSGLLAFIPDDDKYISVFCGALTTIVQVGCLGLCRYASEDTHSSMIEQASTNHGKIATGFASAIGDIGIEIKYLKDQLEVFRVNCSVSSTNSLVVIAAQLYTRIFRFLLPYLRWNQSRWERVKGSLDKTYYDDNIKEPLQEILKFSKYVSREAGVQSSKVLVHNEALARKGLSVGETNLAISSEHLERTKNIEKMMMSNRETMNRFANLSISEENSLGSSLFNYVARMLNTGEHGQAMLMANTERATYNQRTEATGTAEGHMETRPPPTDIEPCRATEQVHNYTFAELELASQSMGSFHMGFNNVSIPFPQQTANKVFGPLQEWLSAIESRILWVYGPSNTTVPSDISLTSAHVVSMINSVKLPLVAHRCRLEDSPTESLNTMVYSLILQLVWLVPEQFSTEKDFTSGRFAKLDKSMSSLPDALLLLEDLLTIAPRLLTCVLDGLQRCEDDKDDRHGTGMFLDFFIEILKQSKDARFLKVMLTTDGFSHRLWRLIDPYEQVDAMNETQTFAGQRKKGGVPMTNLVIAGGSD